MKKKFLRILTFILCVTACTITFAACGDDAPQDYVDSPDSTEESDENFVGKWVLHSLTLEDVTYIVGVDDEKFKEDFNGLILYDSYNLMLNSDGTAVYIEEYETIDGCRWEQDGNIIKLFALENMGNATEIELQYSEGYLSVNNICLKKS